MIETSGQLSAVRRPAQDACRSTGLISSRAIQPVRDALGALLNLVKYPVTGITQHDGGKGPAVQHSLPLSFERPRNFRDRPGGLIRNESPSCKLILDKWSTGKKSNRFMILVDLLRHLDGDILRPAGQFSRGIVQRSVHTIRTTIA